MAALEESLAAIKGEELSGGAKRARRRRPRRRPAAKAAAKKTAEEAGCEGEEQVAGQGREVEIDGRRLSITNLDKVLYPETGFTKGEVIDYYARIGPAILPHLRDRPLTVIRFPDGVEGKHFFEKNSPAHRPDWVRTVPIAVGSRGGTIDFAVCDDLATLVWLAQLAAIELHPSLAKADEIERPTVLAFDLDPGRAGDDRRVLHGRAAGPGVVLRARPRGVPEDLGVEGNAGLRSPERRADVRDDEAVRPRRRAGARELPSRTWSHRR